MTLALLGALAIGLSLGLLGSGGSILTVPILVYLVGQPEKLAIASSLAIVGGIALAGALPWTLKRQVDLRSLLWFGLPGMLGTWLGAWASQWFTGAAQLALFAGVMLLAAAMMFRSPPTVVSAGQPPRGRLAIVGDGLAVGAITGLVGVGGGFLIVPVLVLLLGVPLRTAIGTSLLIITVTALAGLGGHLVGGEIDWPLTIAFGSAGMVGAWIGARSGRRVSSARLQRLFALMLIAIAAFLLARNGIATG